MPAQLALTFSRLLPADPATTECNRLVCSRDIPEDPHSRSPPVRRYLSNVRRTVLGEHS